MPTRTIVCLAASKKHSGFCYAGKDVGSGEWVRPVPNTWSHAITEQDRLIAPDDPAKVGDVLAIAVGTRTGKGYQTENFVHMQQPWRRTAMASYAELAGLIDHPANIWGLGRSSHFGDHDDITEEEALAYQHSLLLIKVTDLTISCEDEGFNEVKMSARADFSYRGTHYRLKITDPAYDDCDSGDERVGEALLCCSLTEPYLQKRDGKQHVSKLVAAIITPETLGR